MNLRKTIGITLSIIAVSIILLITFVFVKGYFQISPYLNQDTKIMPKIESTEDDINSLDEKYNILVNQKNHIGEKITFTDLELNLILKNKLNLSNRIYVQFEDNNLKINFSIPMLNKYLNGNLTADILLTEESFNFDIKEMLANDMVIEEEILKTLELAVQNHAQRNSDLSKLIKNLDEIYIDNNELNIKFK